MACEWNHRNQGISGSWRNAPPPLPWGRSPGWDLFRDSYFVTNGMALGQSSGAILTSPTALTSSLMSCCHSILSPPLASALASASISSCVTWGCWSVGISQLRTRKLSHYSFNALSGLFSSREWQMAWHENRATQKAWRLMNSWPISPGGHWVISEEGVGRWGRTENRLSAHSKC